MTTAQTDIANLCEQGDEHIARDKYGDEAVDAYFTAEGWDVEAARSE